MTTDTETTETAADPILHRVTRLLPVKLTDDELRKLGHDLAAICDDIGAEAERADSVKQELKARMTGLEAKRTQLATLIRRGDELREVEVVTRAHYAAGTASEVRTDTGDVLLARPLTDRERQMSLATPGTTLKDGVLTITGEDGKQTTATLHMPGDAQPAQ